MYKNKQLLTPQELRKLLICDAKRGTLIWRVRPLKYFASTGYGGAKGARARWNAQHLGEPALNTLSVQGYRVGAIFGRMYRSHRVIWAMHCGEWPEEQIDHINGIRDDNRIDNLRAVCGFDNMRNQKRHENNTSGFTGVSWDEASQKWFVQIRANGRSKYLGIFEELSDAVAARKAANIKYGFHENHGRTQ